jgi:hypothetical protein
MQFVPWISDGIIVSLHTKVRDHGLSTIVHGIPSMAVIVYCVTQQLVVVMRD